MKVDIAVVLSTKFARLDVISVKKSHVIFDDLNVADAIFYIQDGWVRLAATCPSGGNIEIGRSGKGDILGAECLSGQLTRTTTAVALSDCSIIRIDKEAALRALREDAAFAEALLECTLNRLNQIETARINQLRSVN